MKILAITIAALCLFASVFSFSAESFETAKPKPKPKNKCAVKSKKVKGKTTYSFSCNGKVAKCKKLKAAKNCKVVKSAIHCGKNKASFDNMVKGGKHC